MSAPDPQIPTLHLLNKAPGHPRFGACCEGLQPGDTLVLVEDAVLLVQSPAREAIPAGVTVYALQADTEARGLGADPDGSSQSQSIHRCSMPALVELTISHGRIINW